MISKYPKIDKNKLFKIIKTYPDKVPLYVIKQHNSRLNDLPKQKYLVPKTWTLGNFAFYVRKQISINSSEALFFFINNTLESHSRTMIELYKMHKNNDGVLVITYNTENTFG